MVRVDLDEELLADDSSARTNGCWWLRITARPGPLAAHQLHVHALGTAMNRISASRCRPWPRPAGGCAVHRLPASNPWLAEFSAGRRADRWWRWSSVYGPECRTGRSARRGQIHSADRDPQTVRTSRTPCRALDRAKCDAGGDPWRSSKCCMVESSLRRHYPEGCAVGGTLSRSQPAAYELPAICSLCPWTVTARAPRHQASHKFPSRECRESCRASAARFCGRVPVRPVSSEGPIQGRTGVRRGSDGLRIPVRRVD